VSNAHCVIVNTGSDVLVMDLHTSSGTLLNKTRVQLGVLKDGDVLTLGDTSIQVAIQVSENSASDSGCGMEFSDPARFPTPVRIQLLHTDKSWRIEESVVLIGRHDDAAIRLDHGDIAARHALLFRFGKIPAVFDLGGRSGLWVNGQRTSLTPLQDGDQLNAGPFALMINSPDLAGAMERVAAAPSIVEPPREKSPFASVAATKASPPVAPAPVRAAGPVKTSLADPPAAEPMEQNISEAWERLNSWRTQLRNGAMAIEEQQNGLAARTAELDARDAALRGQLHDVTRFNEQITVRERELAARMAQMQAEFDVVEAAQKTAEERDAELNKREQDLHRREQAVAQRWARLTATRCPHCKKPINVGKALTDGD